MDACGSNPFCWLVYYDIFNQGCFCQDRPTSSGCSSPGYCFFGSRLPFHQPGLIFGTGICIALREVWPPFMFTTIRSWPTSPSGLDFLGGSWDLVVLLLPFFLDVGRFSHCRPPSFHLLGVSSMYVLTIDHVWTSGPFPHVLELRFLVSIADSGWTLAGGTVVYSPEYLSYIPADFWVFISVCFFVLGRRALRLSALA